MNTHEYSIRRFFRGMVYNVKARGALLYGCEIDPSDELLFLTTDVPDAGV